jgi:uncharacterized OsmC-like protein
MATQPNDINTGLQQMVNGFDTTEIATVIDTLTTDPTLARFEFRAANRWIDAGVNRSAIQGFYGVGREDDSRQQPFEYTNGEPPVLLGNNEGANPVEYLLHALAGCVTTTTVLHAAARGIRIRRLATELCGDLDVQGLLALDASVPPGYRNITIRMDIEADCTDEELEELLHFAQAHSPVCNTISTPVPVRLERVRRD